MLRRISMIAVALVAQIAETWAQSWQNQVNISMCTWTQLRANIIRDRIYLDGGSLWWLQGFSDGTENPVNDGNPTGVLYYLDLSQRMDTAGNQTALFGHLSKTGSAANNLAPDYIDGVMFANDDAFYLYGGLIHLTSSQVDPPANQVLGYERYQYGPFRSAWEPGFIIGDLDNNVTRYITNGAGVSVPSENLGFYFGGMRASDWGPIHVEDGSANTTANTLISVDMSTMRDEQWHNNTLPDYISGRANAELVWIPVSELGLLVAIGGVINTVVIFPEQTLNGGQRTASEQISPSFMELVSVYDVSSGSWYLQNTTGDIPPQLTMFCSVVASAADGSSHNIYIYGGSDGLNATDFPSDDVYVLSLPSFMWIKVYSGTSNHGRKGHRCIRPYPDKMLVLGGELVGPENCLDGGILQVFNLNTLRFQHVYDPGLWNEYEIPDLVAARIGGNSSGGATMTGPASWNSSDLAQLFQTRYARPIKTWYPYNSSNSSMSSPGIQIVPGPKHGLMPWADAIIGVLVALVTITACLLGWFFWRRRRNDSTRAPSPRETGTDISEVIKWMDASSTLADSSLTPLVSGEMEGSVVTDRLVSTDTRNDRTASRIVLTRRGTELGSSPIYEMQEESRALPRRGSRHPVELPTPYNDTGSPSLVSPGCCGSPSQNQSLSEPSPSMSETSPISLQTPSEEAETETPQSPRESHRHVSSLSSLPSSSIDGLLGRTVSADAIAASAGHRRREPFDPWEGSTHSNWSLSEKNGN